MKMTELAKLLRRIRLDRDEYLKDMAHNLGITSSYLSAIENGKRNLTRALLEKICVQYQLPSDTRQKLECAVSQFQKKIEIDLADSSDEKQSFAWGFARKFNELSDDQIYEIKKIIERDD